MVFSSLYEKFALFFKIESTDCRSTSMGTAMGTPIIEAILTQREWKVLEALNTLGRTQSRAVHDKVSDRGVLRMRTHQVLGRLAQCTLVTRTSSIVQSPLGPLHQVLWEVSSEGKRLFFT